MDAMTVYDLVLDLRKTRCGSVVRMRQGDVGAIAVGAAGADRGARVPRARRRARFEAIKPDGTWIRDEADVTGPSTIEYALPPQAASCEGVIEHAYFRVIEADGSQVGSTSAFAIEVLPSIEGAGAGESASYSPELDELMDEMRRLIVDGGAKDYSALVGKPTVNGRTLEGDMQLADLGITKGTNKGIEAMFANGKAR